MSLFLAECFAQFQGPRNIIRDDAIKTLPDAPLYIDVIIVGPGKDLEVAGLHFSKEFPASWRDEGCLNYTEASMGNSEKMTGVKV